MLEWTLPSESKPRKCSALPLSLQLAISAFQVFDSYSAPAERVVTDFGIAHVVVGGKTDGGAVRLEPRHGARRHELVEIRGVCLLDCVAAAAVAAADTVHDDQYNGFLHLYILHTCWFLFIRAYFTSFRSGLQCQFSVCSRKICSFARA